MSIEYEISNDPQDKGDGKGFKFLVKGFDPALPASHDAGSAHGKSVPLYITETWTTRAERDALLKVQMDKAPIIGQDDDGNDILGRAPREVLAAWIAKQIGKPAVKTVTLPTKDVPRTIIETNDEGNEISREVMETVTDRKVNIG